MSLGVLWPQSNVKALYHLENANDSGGGGYTLTEYTISYENGKYGVGLRCNASGTYGAWATTGQDPVGNVTILAWVKFVTVPNAALEPMISLFKTSKQGIKIYFSYSSPNTYLYATVGGGTGRGGAITPVAGVWNLVIVTVSSDKTICVYWNGALLGTGAGSTTTSSETNLYLFRDDGGNGSLNGMLDEVALISEVKTPQWVRNYYAWATGKMI